jgi:hypothetical protein
MDGGNSLGSFRGAVSKRTSAGHFLHDFKGASPACRAGPQPGSIAEARELAEGESVD